MNRNAQEDICIICGQPFERRSWNQKLCTKKECFNRYKVLTNGKYKKIRKKHANETLQEVAKEAREHGMTYGKYVSALAMGKIKE